MRARALQALPTINPLLHAAEKHDLSMLSVAHDDGALCSFLFFFLFFFSPPFVDLLTRE